MALKNVITVVVLAMSAEAFASSRVDEALSLNEGAKKTEKSKSAPKAKVFDSLNTNQTHKTELPKNARHDATAGVFI